MAPVTADHLVLAAVIGIVILGSGATVQYVFLGESVGTTETSVDRSIIVPDGEFTASEISSGTAVTEVGDDGDAFRFGFEAASDEVVKVLLPVENRADVDLLGGLKLHQERGPKSASVKVKPVAETWGNDCTINNTVRTGSSTWEYGLPAYCQDYLGIYVHVPSGGGGSFVFEGELTALGQTAPGDTGDDTDPTGELAFADQTISDQDTVTISNVTFSDTEDDTVTLAVLNTTDDEIGAATVSTEGDYELAIDADSFHSGDDLTAVMYETADRSRALDSDSATVYKQGNFTIQSTGSNSPITEGETLEVTTEIANTGDATDEQEVRLLIDGVAQDSQSRLLDQGENTTVTLNWATVNGDAGTHTAEVQTNDDSESFLVSVNESNESENFSVTIASTNSPVQAGETLDVTAEVENIGNLSGEQDVELKIDGTIRDTQTIILAPGESESVTLSWTTSDGDGGDYMATVRSQNDSADTGVTVQEPASFAVNITDTNSPVVEGDTLQVTADINNTGDITDTQTIELEVDGAVRDQQSITVDGGTVDTITLEWTTADGDAGDYTATVRSEDDQNSTAVTVDQEVGEQVEYQTGSVNTFGQSNSQLEFDITSTANRDEDIIAIAVNESTAGNHVNHTDPNSTFRSPDTSGYLDGQVDINGSEEYLQEPITVPGGQTQTYYLGQFRESVNNDPINMKNEDVTITVFFADGSSYTFTVHT